MRNRNLTLLTSILEAAKALGIAADHGTDFIKEHAVRGLHSALIAAEEVRQAMAEDVAAKKAAREAVEQGHDNDGD